MLQKFFVLTVATINVELQADVLAGVRVAGVFHKPVTRLENAVDLHADFVEAGAGNFITGEKHFDIESFFHVTEKKEREENKAGGENRSDVEPAASGHSDGGDNEKRGCGGQAGGQAAGVKNRAGADEAYAGNDLSGNSGRVGGDAGELLGENSEQSRSETDKHIGAKTGGAVFELALEPNDSAENGRQSDAGERTADDSARQFSAQQIKKMLPVH